MTSDNNISNNSTSSLPYPIYTATVTAPNNIACIKYWGKDSIELNTPINDSISVTLDQQDLRAVTTASASLSYAEDRLWLNGIEEVDAPTSKRFRACVDQIKALATDKISEEDGTTVLISKAQWQTMKVHISSYNTFPTAAGLASSAAGYAALVYSLIKLFGAKEEFEGQFTTIARQGSGSACRSLYGGFVAWRMGSGQTEDASDSIAEQICSEAHWPEIRALICVVSDAKKGTSSTSGMSTSVATSSLLSYRAKTIVSQRMNDIIDAYKNKDFQTFGEITMKDSNQFHAVCLDTYPPIFYLNDVSKSIIRLVHTYNEWAGEIRAAYTFDAGPNAVLYTLEQYQVELCALVLHYFPSSDEHYVSNPSIRSEADQFVLSSDLLTKVSKATGLKGSSNVTDDFLTKVSKATGLKGSSNVTDQQIQQDDVKMIYCTRAGPGPQVLPSSESLIDTKTGLNLYQPS